MSLSDNYAPDVSTGNGVTDTFTGSWTPLSSDYMRVYLETIATGAQVLQTLDTDYSLSFTAAGYSITFLLTPPPSTKRVIRARAVALDQSTEYTTAQGFQGATHENSFDKVTAITQDIRDAVDRSISFPLGSTSTATLPEPEASQLLGWNAAGTDLENKVLVDLDGAVIGSNVQAWDATLDTISALSGLTDNRLVRTDGTVGAYQQSGITVDDSNNVSGMGTLSCGAITSTGSGHIRQIVSTQTGAVATGTTVIPADDTIPQITEGDQYMSLSITPKSATNNLRIDVSVAAASNSGTDAVIGAGLFQDSTANALAFAGFQMHDPSYIVNYSFAHVMVAGTTSATTFKVRLGGHVAGTTTFNGINGSRLYGGVLASSIRITEYVP